MCTERIECMKCMQLSKFLPATFSLLRPRLAQPVNLRLAIRIHPNGERRPAKHLAPGDAGQPLKTRAA